MIDRDPIRTAGRENKVRRRIAGLHPVCLLCGYQNAFTMRGKTIEWLTDRGVPINLLELHHVEGRNHNPELTVPLCPNCHREVTEGLYRANVSMRGTPDLDIQEQMRHEAEAILFDALATSHRQRAEEIRKRTGDN